MIEMIDSEKKDLQSLVHKLSVDIKDLSKQVLDQQVVISKCMELIKDHYHFNGKTFVKI